MARKTSIDKMNDALASILERYGDDVRADLKKVTKEVGNQGAKTLRNKSRKMFNGDDYVKGWKCKTTESATAISATIYNEHFGLPHLLEHGHVTRNGTGRVFQPTPPHEHIAPVAEELVETYEREVLARL